MEKKKKYLILGIIILLVLGGVTVAYLTWSSDKINIGLNSDCFTIDYTKGGDINNASVKLMNESDLIDSNNKFTIKEGIALTYANIGIKSTCGIEGYGSLYLNITSLSDAFTTGNSVGALKYAILKNTSTSTVSITNLLNQSFDIEKKGTITSTGTKKILTKQLSNTTVNKYIIVIYIDKSLSGNDVIGASFSGKISADANQGTVPMGVATEYITNLYTEASKEEVTNNSITYDKAPSVNLMNDRLGGTTTSLDGGNIRYYGASPNNYIYFNCSDYSNQTSSTCEMWRIIGVFDGKVKLIRNTSIGNYSWDNKNTTTGAETDSGKNDWTTARLMKLLNPSDYYTVDTNDQSLGQSLYYNSGSGKCYSGENNATTDCNFASTGIKNDTTRNLIAETTWNIGGLEQANYFPNEIYVYEKGTTVYPGSPTTWKGKIALAYPSDYGYAAEFGTSYCNKQLNSYDDTTCMSNNWMKRTFTSNNLNWLLTHYSVWSSYAWDVRYTWSVDKSAAYDAFGVSPVLYLNSDVEFKGGDGSSANPYKLSA